jgi:hypothetical protein
MGQDFHMTIPFLGCVASATQGRSQSPLDPRDYALDLPTLAIDDFEKSAVHLPTVFGLGPLSRSNLVTRSATPAIQIDHAGANAQRLSRQNMIMLGVIAAVGQQAVDVQMPDRLEQRFLEQRRILAGTDAQEGRRNKMACGMTNQRDFRPFSHAIARAQPPGKMRGAGRGFKPRGIDGGLRFFVDQFQRMGIGEDRTQQGIEPLFLASRCWAWNKVVKCGTFLMPSTFRSSGRSLSNSTMPRSSVLKNCLRTSMASNWCWVNSFLENLEAYAGMVWEAICRAFLANANGERVVRRSVVSMPCNTSKVHKRSEDFNRACESDLAAYSRRYLWQK